MEDINCLKKMKKSQAALEFLMTYGWAILVVLAMIGALFYFGIIDVGNREGSSIEQLQGMCSEVDEICYEDFIQLCDLYFPELDAFTDIQNYVEFLEEEADINGDTWRESDCGTIISQEQEEMREYNPWVNKPNILR